MVVLEPAAVAPIGISEAKAFLRVEHQVEDALIAGLVRSAAETCEAFTGLVLIERAVRETISAGAWVRLEARPVRAIEAVALLAADGSESALAADAYRIDVDAAGDGWVRLSGGAGRLAVRYRAGVAADWNGVPEPLRQGIVRLTAHLYGERSGTEPPPAAVTALWRPWRRMRLG